jgi:hypothetical protein
MKESTLNKCVESFFQELEISADMGACAKRDYLAQSAYEFLLAESKDTAFHVYEIFFGTYRIMLEGAKNPFIDLLDTLRSYEERAATLIEKQRDHFVHSVNVFILGLAIYAANKPYREAFSDSLMDTVRCPENLPTAREEFFFRWGLAALFHDVGYPVEIISNQLMRFLKFVTDADHDSTLGDVKAHLEFDNFRRFNSVAEVVPKKEFIRTFYDEDDSSVYIDLLQPIDLLAQRIHQTIGIPMIAIKNKLDLYHAEMAKKGFVDHGYYSAIIVLKWYGYLIQTTDEEPLRFYHAIVDSACAILLHNYYDKTLIDTFQLAPLRACQNPIAYLLMFCDEMQDWNREAYGILEKYRTQITSANIEIDDRHFGISYYAAKGIIPCQFVENKKKLFSRILNLPEIFSDDLDIDCIALEEIFLEAQLDVAVPRPLLESMERLARVIHEDYIESQKKLGARIFVAEEFDQLEASSRYSNLRQAMNMDKKLRRFGYALVEKSVPGEAVNSLPEKIVEKYAIAEHADWMEGKQRFGWTYAFVRDDSLKQHDCLVPWSELPDKQKRKDINTAENIIKLVNIAGMKIVRIPSNG